MKKLIAYLIVSISYLLLASSVSAQSASLSLSPPSGNFAVGRELEIQVLLDTGGGKSAATDIYLNFDPRVLQVQDIIPGTLYDQYVGEEIDNTSGKAAISGLAKSKDTVYQGKGVFAKVKFIGKNQGSSQVTFDFVPGGRNDSNVASFETENDILTTTTGGSYQITGQGSIGSPVPTSTPKPTIGGGSGGTPPTPQLPVTAFRLPSLLIIGAGAFLLIFSFILLLV